MGTDTPTVAPGYPKRRDDRVYLNPACWLEGVSAEAWAFHVGGYRVCEKWLKDRRGRRLSDEDIHHYGRIVRSFEATLRLMAKLDVLIAQTGAGRGRLSRESEESLSVTPTKAAAHVNALRLSRRHPGNI
jgi:hypothetical protein